MEQHELRAVLVDSRGEGPNATQRRKLGALAERTQYIPTAIVTTNVIARGIMRALSWFRQDTFRAFNSLANAHEWLGMGDLAELEGLVFSMRARMP